MPGFWSRSGARKKWVYSRVWNEERWNEVVFSKEEEDGEGDSKQGGNFNGAGASDYQKLEDKDQR